MRRILLLLCTAAGLLLARAAGADVLELRNGGRLSGTLKELTFTAAGKQATHARADIRLVWAFPTRKDSLELKDGRKLEGELTSVKFRSVGGLLTLEGREVLTVVLGAGLLDNVKKELAKKRARIAEGDAKALLELARWCSGKGLRTDAVQLAKASLKAAPKGECAEKAHRLLGHVRHKGEWMTRAEKAELTKSAEPDKQPKNAKRPDEKRKALAGALANNKDLLAAYVERLDGRKKDLLAAIEEKHREQWDNATKEIRDAANKIRDKQKERAAESRKFRSELQARHATAVEIERSIEEQFGRNSRYATDLRNYLADYQRVRGARDKLAAAIRRKQTKVVRRVTRRKLLIRLAYDKNERILQGGKLLTEEQMAATYDAMLKKD